MYSYKKGKFVWQKITKRKKKRYLRSNVNYGIPFIKDRQFKNKSYTYF